MIATVNKNDRATLCVQLKNILIGEIRSGFLKPGERIAGERVIAEKYGVSRGTAVEALKLLEKDGYIERFAAKGTFIAVNINERLTTVNILFPFPESSISRDFINYSNWVMDTETYYGLLDGAKKHNVSINFQHFEVSSEPSVIMSQMKKIRSFDAVFFINSQFDSLMEAVNSENIPYLLIDLSSSSLHPMTISYQRKKAIKDCADYLANCGYRSIGMLLNDERSPNIDWKISYFLECLNQRGLGVPEKFKYYLPDDKEKGLKLMRSKMAEDFSAFPEVFFCETMTSPIAFLKLAHERHWEVGKDVDLFGYAGETALRNTIPSITYLKIPYMEIGREACRILYERVAKKQNENIHLEIPARIIEGDSTRRPK